MLKRPMVSGAGGVLPVQDSGVIAERWPNLREWVRADVWPDGGKRVPGSVLLVTGDGVFKAMLKDADQGLVCWLSADTLEGLFDRIQAVLEDGSGEWRQDKWQRTAGRRPRG